MSDDALSFRATELVYVVSGLPRSGTSLMMQMLSAGGLDVLTDGERKADDDNPYGYYELEAVKRTRTNPSWLTVAGGKAVKVISQLLVELPAERRYKVVFMRRALDEVLLSQQKMLRRRATPLGASDRELKELFIEHLAELEAWLKGAAHLQVHFVNYARLLEEPRASAERVVKFLELALDVDAMVSCIKVDLYRSRSSEV